MHLGQTVKLFQLKSNLLNMSCLSVPKKYWQTHTPHFDWPAGSTEQCDFTSPLQLKEFRIIGYHLKNKQSLSSLKQQRETTGYQRLNRTITAAKK